MIKALSLRLNQIFGPFTMSRVEGSSQTGAFRHLSKHVFAWSVISEIHKLCGTFLFENVGNLMQIQKTHKKIEKKCFVFEINASEYIAFTCLY